MRRRRNLPTTNKMNYCHCKNQHGKRIASDCEDCGGVVRVDAPKTNSALEFLAQELDMPAEHIRQAARAMKEQNMQLPLLCRIGRHKFRRVMWPVGYAKHPACVGECTRCGQVRDVEATAWGGVELGRWASLAEMRQRIADEKADETSGRSAYNTLLYHP